MPTPLLLQPGTLWPALVECTRRALASGALLPIATEPRFIDDAGVRFAVRKAENLVRKDAVRRQRQRGDDAPHNPFLPFEQALLVAPISPSHVALLNKFNVIDHHLLIVTRRFEHQETLLTAGDFVALAACLREFDALAFYNAGPAAGASQTHKHLQLVPLPLGGGSAGVPIEPLLDAARGRRGVCTVPGFGFRHAYARFDARSPADAVAAGHSLQSLYEKLFEAAGLRGIDRDGETRQSAPYNLLVTRRWMLVIPRSRECYGTLSINALGYAGSLFVRDDEEFETLRRAGPVSVLRELAVP
jgi:ATP adenylyltransferase